jgi:hypothetical protein
MAEANAGEGMTILLTYWIWAHTLMSKEEGLILCGYMNEKYQIYVVGNHLKEIMQDANTEGAYQMTLRGGFHVRHRYEKHPLPNPPISFHPYLMGVHKEEALAQEGHQVAYVFTYRPPKIFFTVAQRELLLVALREQNPKKIASELSVTEGAIKRRWDRIYERMEEVLPGYLPKGPQNRRGEEKKWKTLAYIREHLEELRPYAKKRTRRNA